MGSVGCCAAATTATPTCPGRGCCAGSTSATPTVTWPRPGSPPRTCDCSTATPTRPGAAAAFYRWLTFCADANVPELQRLARTLDSWRDELLARFTVADVSNGPTEAINLLIKKVKRVGHGFRNFNNYRLRLLLHCGIDWDTIPATPIRGRLPRLVA